MADVEDAPTIPAPTPNPDAQTTVNDFLDYTEFYPSDLVRSLTLIGDLDATYADAVQQVHELTSLYCKLPSLPERERTDPALLRKQIAQQLQKAINQREYAFTEAARLYEVTVRHCQRSSIIKRKLQAQPEPPSRDPTPPPVSPQALKRSYDRPRLHLTFDGGRNKHQTSAVPLPRGRSRAHSTSSSDESDGGRRTDHAERPRKAQTYKDRSQKPRPRAPGVAGTNVHSSIAGISTSNALAKLSPPPPDARPGSKWAPWMKLTEYEMAVLRKQMKKNAVWTPSLTMVNRELERKHRTKGDYEREKARCEAAGEDLLDEEPETLLQIATAQGVDDPALAATANAAKGLTAPSEAVPARDESVEATEGKSSDRDTRRKKAMRQLQALEDATKTIQNAADGLKELTFSAHAVPTPPTSAQRKKSTARPVTSKRKRDTTPPPNVESPTEPSKEPEAAEKDTTTQEPEPKRPRLQLIAPAPPPDHTPSTPAPPSADTHPPKDLDTPVALSPAAQTPTPLPERITNTVQVPLAPAGPSTPKVNKPESRAASREATPVQPSSTEPKRSSPIVALTALEQAPAPPTTTAIFTRSRRESVASKNSSPPPAEPSKPTRSNTPMLERAASPEPAVALRPRSARGHIPTPKAQSEEPTPNESGRPIRDTRRHSIFSQSALTAPAPTRVSSRRKPPPKGEVTSAENGQKTVTNVKRSQGSKNNKKKKPEDQPGLVEEVDSDEERYCICDDVSYGQMISCDNNVRYSSTLQHALPNGLQCDKEWFHFECVGMTQMPARRAKWYCPDCREKLGTDAFGNAKVPPALPGRSRGNR
ncbi:hypothetical protein BU25DRAFT_80 [Macroventuria anomochaeta]|uniref:Uncharacterized protein n=1 Tax=Macroventuria anomochaeta TaxID=301207 RepID=A0ACB6SI34_9PLEO|nr:uncharacterized protein BU25DRAFT_80 [Macroventuria anomochaeta]KAF2633147.1 hypothetical protein BU25DRAFT_80 [Macroventuria anomochaeta]